MSAPVQKDKAKEEKEKGNAAFKSGDFVQAIAHYTSAVVADPSDPTFPMNRAMAYLKLGKYLDAERDASTAIRLQPSNVKAYFRRGTARKGAGKLKEGEEDFTRVLELDPANKEANTELAAVQQMVKAQPKSRTKPMDLASPTSTFPDKGKGKGKDDSSSSSASIFLSSQRSASAWAAPDAPDDLKSAGSAGSEDSARLKQALEGGRARRTEELKEVSTRRMADAKNNSTSVTPVVKAAPPQTFAQAKEQRDARTAASRFSTVTPRRMVEAATVSSVPAASSPVSGHQGQTESARDASAPTQLLSSISSASPSTASFIYPTISPRTNLPAPTLTVRNSAPPSSSKNTLGARPPDVELALPAEKLNGWEFGRRWKALGGTGARAGAGGAEEEGEGEVAKRRMGFLLALPPGSLPAILGALLDSELLSSIISVLSSAVLPSPSKGEVEAASKERTETFIGDNETRTLWLTCAARTLEDLSGCQRFSVESMFLEDKEKSAVRSILELAASNRLVSDPEALKRALCL